MAASVHLAPEQLPEFDEFYSISDLHMGGRTGFQIFNSGDALAAFIEHVRTLPTASVVLVHAHDHPGIAVMASCSAVPTPSRPSSRLCSNISSAGALQNRRRRSAAISAAVADAFAAVAGVRQGNAFTNANKALAHIMAYGRHALEAPPRRLSPAVIFRTRS